MCLTNFLQIFLAFTQYVMYNILVKKFGGLYFMTFNSIVLAETPTNGGGVGGLLSLVLPLVIFIGAMYLFIIRPQKKKEKADKLMRENLQVGDEILTIGGIYGRVISLKEDTIVIESKSDHSKITIARWAMQQNLTVHDDTPAK